MGETPHQTSLDIRFVDRTTVVTYVQQAAKWAGVDTGAI